MKTLVIGASENPERYSNKAIRLLREYGHTVVAIGNKPGFVNDVSFSKEKTKFDNIHTVSLYINPKYQIDYEAYLISLKPHRVIFNPGTENLYFENKLREKDIEAIEACTLVLLRTNQF